MHPSIIQNMSAPANQPTNATTSQTLQTTTPSQVQAYPQQRKPREVLKHAEGVGEHSWLGGSGIQPESSGIIHYNNESIGHSSSYQMMDKLARMNASESHHRNCKMQVKYKSYNNEDITEVVHQPDPRSSYGLPHFRVQKDPVTTRVMRAQEDEGMSVITNSHTDATYITHASQAVTQARELANAEEGMGFVNEPLHVNSEWVEGNSNASEEDQPAEGDERSESAAHVQPQGRSLPPPGHRFSTRIEEHEEEHEVSEEPSHRPELVEVEQPEGVLSQPEAPGPEEVQTEKLGLATSSELQMKPATNGISQ